MGRITTLFASVALLGLVGCAKNEVDTLSAEDKKLPAGWELVPKADYTASQDPGQVTLVARGNAPKLGYEVKFIRSRVSTFPPQYILVWKPPAEAGGDTVTPFEAKASFRATEVVKSVTVFDGAGRHPVDVDQARDLSR